MLGATEVHPMFLGLFTLPHTLGSHPSLRTAQIYPRSTVPRPTTSAPCASMSLIFLLRYARPCPRHAQECPWSHPLHCAMPKNDPDLECAMRDKALCPRIPLLSPLRIAQPFRRHARVSLCLEPLRIWRQAIPWVSYCITRGFFWISQCPVLSVRIF